MAREPGGAAGRLSALVEEIEAEAYARGKADARKEILALLKATGAPAPRPRERRKDGSSGTRSARKRRTAGGKRAPRGSVRALVERALHGRPGLSAREILDHAGTDAERLVKLGSIRVELQTGRQKGRYESEDGRWSLSASPLAEDDDTLETPPSHELDSGVGSPADAFQAEAGPSPEAAEVSGTAAGDGPEERPGAGEPEARGGQGKLGMNW